MTGERKEDVFFCQLILETLQEKLETELDTDLGYHKNVQEGSENRRNCICQRRFARVWVNSPSLSRRDREGEFEPSVVKKHQREITGIEKQILTL